MLVIEVQLPQQEGRKKIEWNKNGDPTFEELKGRLQQCGVPDDWCVEVLRGSSFVSPDLQSHIQGPKITVRASPVLGGRSHQLPKCSVLTSKPATNWLEFIDLSYMPHLL